MGREGGALWPGWYQKCGTPFQVCAPGICKDLKGPVKIAQGHFKQTLESCRSVLFIKLSLG